LQQRPNRFVTTEPASAFCMQLLYAGTCIVIACYRIPLRKTLSPLPVLPRSSGQTGARHDLACPCQRPQDAFPTRLRTVRLQQAHAVLASLSTGA
jgi:hypothetical protein